MAAGISIDLIGREVEVGGPVASYWVQLASAIVSGLSFATLLTLIVTPSLLMAPQAIRQLLREIEARINDYQARYLASGLRKS